MTARQTVGNRTNDRKITTALGCDIFSCQAAQNGSSGRPYVLLVMFFSISIYLAGYTSELPRPIAVKLCHMIVIWVRFIMQVQKFGGPPSKEIGGQKHAKLGAISDNI